jgi:hypothetical protein
MRVEEKVREPLNSLLSKRRADDDNDDDCGGGSGGSPAFMTAAQMHTIETGWRPNKKQHNNGSRNADGPPPVPARRKQKQPNKAPNKQRAEGSGGGGSSSGRGWNPSGAMKRSVDEFNKQADGGEGGAGGEGEELDPRLEGLEPELVERVRSEILVDAAVNKVTRI